MNKFIIIHRYASHETVKDGTLSIAKVWPAEFTMLLGPNRTMRCFSKEPKDAKQAEEINYTLAKHAVE